MAKISEPRSGKELLRFHWIHVGNERFSLAVGLAGIAVWIVLLNLLCEWQAGSSYLNWCIANGSLISLAAALISLLWKDTKFELQMISVHPARFMTGLVAFGAIVGQTSRGVLEGPPGGLARVPPSSRGEQVWDDLLVTFWTALLMLMYLAWAFVFAPFHYLLSIFTGAIARRASRDTGTKILATVDENGLVIAMQPSDSAVPDGSRDLSFSSHPMAVTSFMNAVVLFAADWWLNV